MISRDVIVGVIAEIEGLDNRRRWDWNRGQGAAGRLEAWRGPLCSRREELIRNGRCSGGDGSRLCLKPSDRCCAKFAGNQGRPRRG